MPIMLFVILALIFVILLIVVTNIVIVPQSMVYVVERVWAATPTPGRPACMSRSRSLSGSPKRSA